MEDLDLFCKILYEKYPHMQNAAEAYLKGDRFYPCNMFLMKRELFDWYCGMLFGLLEAYEQQAKKRPGKTRYSREGCRTPGHLGERFLGMFYEYIRQLGTYQTKELQMALVMHTQKPAVRKPRPQDTNRNGCECILCSGAVYLPSVACRPYGSLQAVSYLCFSYGYQRPRPAGFSKRTGMRAYPGGFCRCGDAGGRIPFKSKREDFGGDVLPFFDIGSAERLREGCLAGQ